MMNLRKELYLAVMKHGFDEAVARFNGLLRSQGVAELSHSDWGKFLQNSPTREMRQSTNRVRALEVALRMQEKPAVASFACHSLNVCWSSPEGLCMDHECPVNRDE